MIAPAERYEILVNFADGRAVDLSRRPMRIMGAGMMMQMMAARAPSCGEMEHLMQFRPDPALKAAVTRLPRQLATLAAPDVKSAVAWRTFELNPMMGMGMMGDGGIMPEAALATPATITPAHHR